jgi:hypothetical protein
MKLDKTAVEFIEELGDVFESYLYSAASSFRNWEYVKLFSKERFQILLVRTI